MRKVLAAAVLAIGFSTAANAAVFINIDDVGNNLVVSYRGSVDLASTLGKEADRGADFSLISDDFSGIAGAGSIFSYNRGSALDDYILGVQSVTIPTGDLFGSSGPINNGINSGDAFLVDILVDPNTSMARAAQIWLPDGYISGASFSGSTTFLNASLSDLSANLGTYVWSWSNNGVSDTLTVSVGPVTPVPLPAALPFLAGGLGVLGFMGWRRKRVA